MLEIGPRIGNHADCRHPRSGKCRGRAQQGRARDQRHHRERISTTIRRDRAETICPASATIGSAPCQRPAKSRGHSTIGRKTRRGSSGEQGILRPIPFVAPWLILFGYFLLYPIGYGLYISFFKWNLLTPKVYVGLMNYRRLLHDTLFQKSLHNTLFFVAVCAPLAIVIPLFLAVLIDSPVLGRTFFRSAFTTPLMMSVTTVSLLWVWFLNPVFGLVNHYLDLLGLPQQHWLTQSPWSLGRRRPGHGLVDHRVQHGYFPRGIAGSA